MAEAMAQQAKAMAAMASTYMRAEPDDALAEALGGGLGLRGARGTAALYAWRKAFTERPQAVAARVRENRNRAMTGLSTTPDMTPSMRGYFTKEVPFGPARTAAYLIFGLADIADLMERGRWHEAEALTMLLLAASEQAALQEWNWGLAWLLTFSSEPPWSLIRSHPSGTPDVRAVSRLADPELLAAAVGHLKDMMSIADAQRRSVPTAAASSSSGGAAATTSADAGRGRGSAGRGKRGRARGSGEASGETTPAAP